MPAPSLPVQLCKTIAFLLAAVAPATAADEHDSNTVVYTSNEEWKAIEWNPRQVPKGNALDFSRFLDAPAGKHGEVIIEGETFAFADAPDQPVHFYGTNLTHRSPITNKEDSALIADKLAAEGFNTVRFHMNEEWLTKEHGNPEFNPDKKDAFDYLISCLRERGIYYVMTIYSAQRFKPGDITDVEAFSDKSFQFEIKGLAMVSEQAIGYMQRYAKNLLCDVNPYTGLAPKDDPALISVELTNEDALLKFRNHYPELTPVFTEKCRKYLTERDGKEPTDAEVEVFYNQYLVLLQEQFYKRMERYLRNDLNITKPISDINHRSNLAYTPVRELMDYVDIHAYWRMYKYLDAQFGGGMFPKKTTKSRSYDISFDDPIRLGWDALLLGGASRLMEKPFACGEFNAIYPAPQRMFTVPMQSALAGLQGWSMILHYGYASNPGMVLDSTPEKWLNIATSPLSLLSERMGNLFFGRGQVAASSLKIPLVITRDYLDLQLEKSNAIQPPKIYTQLGWICRIGVILADDTTDLSAYPCVVIPDDLIELPESVRNIRYHRADYHLFENLKDILETDSPDIITSTTDQIQLDSNAGTFTVTTPQGVCLLLTEGAASAQTEVCSVSGNDSYATCFLASLDDKPLIESSHMLALYLTDLKNSGTTIESLPGEKPIIHNEGELPHLVRQGQVQFTVNTTDNRTLPQVWALHYDGSRSVEIPVVKTDSGFAFKAQAVTSADTYSAFEISW